MDTSAFVATLTSGLAMGLTVVLLRVMRQDRQRSEARVATLVTLSGRSAARVPSRNAQRTERGIGAPRVSELGGVQGSPPERFDSPPVKLAPRAARGAQPLDSARSALSSVEGQPVRETRALKGRATSLSAADVEIFRDASAALPAASIPELFEPAVPRTGNSLLYIGVGAIVMASLIALGFRWAVSSSAAPTTETSAAIAAPAAPVAQPIALVSLRHEQSADGTLVISGVVRNPVESIAREKLFAAASLVDRDGGLIATARAPLDFTMLAPGEESPFVVRIAGANGVARYRIGFRDAGGSSVAHVDRR